MNSLEITRNENDSLDVLEIDEIKGRALIDLESRNSTIFSKGESPSIQNLISPDFK